MPLVIESGDFVLSQHSVERADLVHLTVAVVPKGVTVIEGGAAHVLCCRFDVLDLVDMYRTDPGRDPAVLEGEVAEQDVVVAAAVAALFIRAEDALGIAREQPAHAGHVARAAEGDGLRDVLGRHRPAVVAAARSMAGLLMRSSAGRSARPISSPVLRIAADSMT